MSSQTVWKHTLNLFGSKPVVVEPGEGSLTSDAGLLPIREFDRQLGLTQQFADVLEDPRGADAEPGGGADLSVRVDAGLPRDTLRARERGRLVTRLFQTWGRIDPNAAVERLKAALGPGAWLETAADTLKYRTDWRGRRVGEALLVARPDTTERVWLGLRAALARR